MKIVKTGQFREDQLRIEDHIFQSNNEDIQYVEKFLDQLDNAVLWVKANATTPKKMMSQTDRGLFIVITEES